MGVALIMERSSSDAWRCGIQQSASTDTEARDKDNFDPEGEQVCKQQSAAQPARSVQWMEFIRQLTKERSILNCILLAMSSGMSRGRRVRRPLPGTLYRVPLRLRLALPTVPAPSQHQVTGALHPSW